MIELKQQQRELPHCKPASVLIEIIVLHEITHQLLRKNVCNFKDSIATRKLR
jgi:hypothetical protein